MLTWYLIIALTVWITITVYLLVNTRKIGFLKAIQPKTIELSLDIIVAVRNEEANLEQALTSLCHVAYSNYRIIVVNDRSTDRTSQILEKLAAEYPQIIITTINELPAHWLGKTHAIYRGYQQSTSEWILFTDADIVFEKNTLKKALTYCTGHQLDFLALLPHIKSRSEILNSIMHTFALMFDLKFRTWEAKNPKSKAGIGVGAFSLVKRDSYERAGTHKAIKLCTDDDVKLGRLMKQAGFKLDVLYGEDEIQLEWYTSVAAFVNGLMKNMFSASNYNLGLAIFNSIGTLLLFCLPVPIGLLSCSTTGILFSLGILFTHWCLFTFKPGHKKWWHFLTITYAGAIMAYVILRAALLAKKNGGIYWRESFYPLDELKRNSK